MDLVEAYPKAGPTASDSLIKSHESDKISTSKPISKVVEKTVRGWTKKEKTLWLCYLVKIAIERPYENLQVELTECTKEQRIYKNMCKAITGRSPRQCEQFSKVTLFAVKMKGACLLQWLIKMMRNAQDQETVQPILQEYLGQRSRMEQYMALIDTQQQISKSTQIQGRISINKQQCMKSRNQDEA